MTDGRPMRVVHTRFKGDRTFTHPVNSVDEGLLLLEALREYDSFNARYAGRPPAEQRVEVRRGDDWVEVDTDRASRSFRRPSGHFALPTRTGETR